MNTTLRISERYNLGGYEHVDLTVTVEADVQGPQDVMDLHDKIDAVMHQGRLRVAELTRNPDSMIQDHPALSGDEK